MSPSELGQTVSKCWRQHIRVKKLPNVLSLFPAFTETERHVFELDILCGHAWSFFTQLLPDYSWSFWRMYGVFPLFAVLFLVSALSFVYQ
jgi:hypothetical protein